MADVSRHWVWGQEKRRPSHNWLLFLHNFSPSTDPKWHPENVEQESETFLLSTLGQISRVLWGNISRFSTLLESGERKRGLERTLFAKEDLCHKILVYGFRSQEDEPYVLDAPWCLGKLFAILFISVFQVSMGEPDIDSDVISYLLQER